MLPFAATWMVLETVTLNEVVRQRQTPSWNHSMLTLKHDTNKLIHETDIDSQTWRADLWLLKWKGRGGERN